MIFHIKSLLALVIVTIPFVVGRKYGLDLWNVTKTGRNSHSKERILQTKTYYYAKTDFGTYNPDVSKANPMKGLMGSPFYELPYPNTIPSSLEYYYVGLDKVMFCNASDTVGCKKPFDWTYLDTEVLKSSERRSKHAVIRFIVHDPDEQPPLFIPKYLLDAGIRLVKTNDGDQPFYGDKKLLESFQQFIQAFGARYDGDQRIFAIQLGLLGKWGEWHTWPQDNLNLIPVPVRDQVIGWYLKAFNKTKLQVRYYKNTTKAYPGNIGLHDDSFTYETLDDQNDPFSEYFWPEVVRGKQTDFWKKSVMGGETYPDLQPKVFEDKLFKSTTNKQSFMRCVNVTHATLMLHYDLFKHKNEQPIPTQTEINNALYAHARMGYNFVIERVAVSTTSSNKVLVDVTIAQKGIAPFYYPLSLYLRCPGLSKPLEAKGLETIISQGNKRIVSFQNVPKTTYCLNNVSLFLNSTMVYSKRPIKFAQGNGTITFKIPLP